MLRDQRRRIWIGFELGDDVGPHATLDVVRSADEVQDLPALIVHHRCAVDLEPAVIVSLDREKNDVTPRRIRQSVGTPFAHEPRGKRRMIRLRDEQLAISVRPDNHRLALARESEDEQFIVVRAASETRSA